MAEISNFEHRLDQFLWAVAEFRPEVAKQFSSRAPHTFDQKFEFWRHCLIACPDLRTIPLYEDGYIHFTAIFLIAKEITEVRADLAHGEVTVIKKVDGTVSYYSLERIRRVNRNPETQILKIGVSILESIASNASSLEWLLGSYIKLLRGSWSYEAESKEQRRLRDSRKILAEYGVLPEGFSVDMKEITLSFPVNL